MKHILTGLALLGMFIVTLVLGLAELIAFVVFRIVDALGG